MNTILYYVLMTAGFVLWLLVGHIAFVVFEDNKKKTGTEIGRYVHMFSCGFGLLSLVILLIHRSEMNDRLSNSQ